MGGITGVRERGSTGVLRVREMSSHGVQASWIQYKQVFDITAAKFWQRPSFSTMCSEIGEESSARDNARGRESDVIRPPAVILKRDILLQSKLSP